MLATGARSRVRRACRPVVGERDRDRSEWRDGGADVERFLSPEADSYSALDVIRQLVSDRWSLAPAQ